MIDYLGYNLTQYKSFRQLQLQFTKVKNQNDTLQSQVKSLTQAYEYKCKQVIQLKSQDMQLKFKLKNKNLKYKKLYRQLIDNIESNLGCIKLGSSAKQVGSSAKQVGSSGRQVGSIGRQTKQRQIKQSNTSQLMIKEQNDKSIFMHLEQVQTMQKVCKKLSNMTKDYISLKQKNNILLKKIQNIDREYKSEQIQKQRTQVMIMKQINNLQSQLQQLNECNIQLQSKLNIKEKQNRKLLIQIRQIRNDNVEIEQRLNKIIKYKLSQQQQQQDNEFVIDLMTFQLQTIQCFFNKIIINTKLSKQLSNIMNIIYTDYQQLTQIFKEKLQIQYDLQELQQRYKSQKQSNVSSSNNTNDNLLIQNRRQIQAFRLQLLKHKQIYRQKQLHIQNHFNQYIKINQTQMKIKNYSYQLQNKLYQQKKSQFDNITTRNQTARNILNKRFNHYQSQLKDKQDRNVEYINPNNNNLQNINNNNQFIKYQDDYQQQTHDKQFNSNYNIINDKNKKTSLKFKPTHNVQQLMNQIINKDKNNLQQMLKQNRKSNISHYLKK